MELASKLQKSLNFLKSELNQVRTGRASPSLVEDVIVNAYSSKMSVKELGSITLFDPQNIMVSPWDKNLIDSIIKAIRESELKVNPVKDNDRIRIPVPPLTEERRKELAKIVSTKIEECKQAMRNIRQDAMKDIEKLFSEKKIGEDEKFSQKEEVEDTLKDFIKQAGDLGEGKKKDLLMV